MVFSLRLDGTEIASTDDQVIGVRLLTARGEAAAIGLSNTDGIVDIVLDRVMPGGPPRLDHIENAAMQAIRDRSIEGQPVGVNPLVSNSVPVANQGAPTSTLQQGGNTTTNAPNLPPATDLATGLDPTDTHTLTARIEAFGSHGDAAKAISDNPPNSGAPTQTSSGAVQDTSTTDTSTTTPPAVTNPFAPAPTPSTTAPETPAAPAGATTLSVPSPDSGQTTSGTASTDTASTDTVSTNVTPPQVSPGDVVIASSGNTADTVVTASDVQAAAAKAQETVEKVDSLDAFAKEPAGTVGVVEADGIHIKSSL